MDEVLCCHHCGDAIGVYEPLVAVADGEARETSRAANPLGGLPEACYHLACFERLQSWDAKRSA